MRKLIAAINMTLDGICDHTAGIADEEIHQHYADLLCSADTIAWGRITYQLMEYWRTVIENPTGNQAADDFANVIENIAEKIVFSRTLKSVDWKNARIAKNGIKEEMLALKQQEGKDILVGSPSLITACLNLNLVDECQFCIHPVIERKGLRLFENIDHRINLQLTNAKTFSCGAVIHYYKPTST